MAVRLWIALLVVLGLAPAVQAASLGVAWNPSDEPGVTGYRVYIGTSPGRPTEVFDVGPFQTSFFYAAAIAGRDYFFSVATRAGSVIGAASEEVWGTAGAPATGTFEGFATRSAGPFREVASAGSSLFELGGGLAAVSSMVFSPEGVGFFIEGGRTIRRLEPGGLSDEPALEAGAGERFLSLAVDPRFAVTGHVYVAVEAMTAGGHAEVRVVRHRLAGLLLGEPATVIAALVAAASAPALAVTPAGHILVAQPGRLLRFALDGTVPRDQAGGSPMWALLDVQPEVAVWDAARNGLWVVGREVSGAVAARFVEEGAVARTTELKSPDGPAIEQVAATIVSGRAQAHVLTATGLSSIDLATGSSLGLRVSRIAAPIVFGTIAPAGDALVVVETAPQGATPTHSLLRVFSAAPPPGAREVLSRLP